MSFASLLSLSFLLFGSLFEAIQLFASFRLAKIVIRSFIGYFQMVFRMKIISATIESNKPFLFTFVF